MSFQIPTEACYNTAVLFQKYDCFFCKVICFLILNQAEVSSGLFSFNFLIKACALTNLSSQPPAELKRESVLRLLIRSSSSQLRFGLAFSKGEEVMVKGKSKIFSSHRLLPN